MSPDKDIEPWQIGDGFCDSRHRSRRPTDLAIHQKKNRMAATRRSLPVDERHVRRTATFERPPNPDRLPFHQLRPVYVKNF